MLSASMKPHGTYKIPRRKPTDEPGLRPIPGAPGIAYDPLTDPVLGSAPRLQRILISLRNEIIEGGGGVNIRVRQIFREPREIFRLELELPELGYQRTTLLDRDALEELLESDAVREIVHASALGQ
ncbi:MAG: hypothetical protein ACE5FL_00855 [Myxococcota bacterium]